jgi:hypothetical protein
MTDEEVRACLREYIDEIVVSTLHPDGSIHSVAMYYGILGGQIGVLTKRKSQKVQNLLRDPRMTCLMANGSSYQELRGVELVGTAVVTDDLDTMRELAISIRRRRGQPFDEDSVLATVHNRVALLHTATRVVSWDHRKLQCSDE